MENFVDILGYEGLYQINNLGHVWSCRRKRLLKPGIGCGYKRVVLCKNKKKKAYSIHRLIAIHFIPNPDNLSCVDHINRIRDDNSIDNLRWVSHRDNAINSDRIDNRRGNITVINGKTETTYRLGYNLQGEYGNQHRKYNNSKSFKTMKDLEIFQNEIYNL